MGEEGGMGAPEGKAPAYGLWAIDGAAARICLANSAAPSTHKKYI